MRATSIARRAGGIWLAATLVLPIVFPDSAGAQSGRGPEDQHGFVFVETFQGTSDTVGTVTKLDTTLGYRFTPHFEVDAGVPFYFVHASPTSTATGFNPGSGLGNAYIDLQVRFIGSSASFISSLKGAAPTGSTDKGLSTGRVTADWNNYLAFTAGRITPFGNLGLANSISDTNFFTRPFTSLGKNAHFEGGAEVQVWRALSLGASAYAVSPFGQQKVFSKLISREQGVSPGRGRGRGPMSGVFENQSVTVGDASITRDRGGSVWADLNARQMLDLQVGFSRSVEYDLNSVFFSAVLNVGRWIRTRR